MKKDAVDKLLDLEDRTETEVPVKGEPVTIEYIYERTWTALNRLRDWVQRIACSWCPTGKRDKPCTDLESGEGGACHVYLRDAHFVLGLWDAFAELRVHERFEGIARKNKVEGEEGRGTMIRRAGDLSSALESAQARIAELEKQSPRLEDFGLEREEALWRQILGEEEAAASVIRVSRAAVQLRLAIEALCTVSRERSLALTKLEEAVLWAHEHAFRRVTGDARDALWHKQQAAFSHPTPQKK